MRPYALMEHSPESLGDDEVCRGRLLQGRTRTATRRKSFDILSSFLDVLGKPVRRGPGQLRARRGARGHRDGPGDQRHQGAVPRELADRSSEGTSPTTPS